MSKEECGNRFGASVTAVKGQLSLGMHQSESWTIRKVFNQSVVQAFSEMSLMSDEISQSCQLFEDGREKFVNDEILLLVTIHEKKHPQIAYLVQ